MKRTLLDMVQSILSDMDGEDVNSITDSIEAQQIASVIEDTYYNIISVNDKPEYWELYNLVSLSDSSRPTHFRYSSEDVDEIKSLRLLRYDISETSGVIKYKEIPYCEPIDFIERMPYNSSNTVRVYDKNAATSLFIRNDTMPSRYTSFDDEHIVVDSYKATVESTLQASKTQAFVFKIPSFTISDTFVPDMEDHKRPYLLAEAKSTCMSLWRDGSDPKIEQAARRMKNFIQNDERKTQTPPKRPMYGRR
jgi:hypothetical protein